MDRELTKLYYSIGEVADMFGVAPSLLRYWETEFPGLKPQKNRRGDRKYTKKEIEYLEEIYTLVKLRGFTLDGARKALRSGNKITPDHKDLLQEKLNAIKKELDSMGRLLGN